MALRLIEVFLPAEHGARLQESLSKDGVVAHWTEQLSEQQILVRILLQVEDTEPFLDRLEDSLAGTDFRAVLVSVEATIPRLEPEKEPQPAAEVAASEQAEKEEAPSPRISREELYQQVNEGAQLTRTFVVLVALSAVVAAVGVAYNNVTVVIGAMVIAPLLGPNVALSLATALGDIDLAKSAAKTDLVGILVALAIAIPIAFLVRVDPRVARNPDPASCAAKGCCSCACFGIGRRAFDHHGGVGCPDWSHGCGGAAPSVGDLRAAGRRGLPGLGYECAAVVHH